MKIFTTLLGSLLLVLATTLLGCEAVGACHGYSDILDSSYCYDDWYDWECEEYDAEGVNGADWYFWEGQTCAERGL